MARDDVLVSVEDLPARLSDVRLIDVRWRLGDSPGAGRTRYARGHLPGARYLDLETALTTHTGQVQDGRHPLPAAADLADGLAACGVQVEDELVVYDEPGSFAAERAWWVLRWAGLRVRVLDGGIDAWVAAGGPLAGGDPEPIADVVHLELTSGGMPTVDADGAASTARSGVLLDARAEPRYAGEVEPLDPRAGHIPGALNLPAAGLYDSAGRLPAANALRERFGALGPALDDADGPVAVYCGSGVSATRDVLALAALGIESALFPGSWSAWSNDPERPVATGPTPG